MGVAHFVARFRIFLSMFFVTVLYLDVFALALSYRHKRLGHKRHKRDYVYTSFEDGIGLKRFGKTRIFDLQYRIRLKVLIYRRVVLSRSESREIKN